MAKLALVACGTLRDTQRLVWYANCCAELIRPETKLLGYDLIGLIVLLLAIWALVGILQSGASPVEKLIWVIIVLVMPLLGFILWYVIGPGTKAFPLRR